MLWTSTCLKKKNRIISGSHLLNLSQAEYTWFILPTDTLQDHRENPAAQAQFLPLERSRILLRKHKQLHCYADRTLQSLFHPDLQSRGFKAASGALLPNSPRASGLVLLHLSTPKCVWEQHWPRWSYGRKRKTWSSLEVSLLVRDGDWNYTPELPDLYEIITTKGLFSLVAFWFWLIGLGGLFVCFNWDQISSLCN